MLKNCYISEYFVFISFSFSWKTSAPENSERVCLSARAWGWGAGGVVYSCCQGKNVKNHMSKMSALKTTALNAIIYSAQS